MIVLEKTRSNLTAKWQMWKMFYSHHHDDLDHAEKYYITEYLRDIGMALNLKEEQLFEVVTTLLIPLMAWATLI